MPTLAKKYLYKISRNGELLGNLSNVKSDFGYSLDINTAATSLEILVGDQADTSHQANEPIQDELGEEVTTENNEVIRTERVPDFVGDGNSAALIRNDNDIEVYEYSDAYPNGKLVFSGFISKWKVRFGETSDIALTCLSYGVELDNYLIIGGDTLDQSQTTIDANELQAYEPGKGGAWLYQGQTFTTGVGVINLASIKLKLHVAAGVGGSVGAVVKVWASVGDFFIGSPLGTATRTISATDAAEYTFTFATPIDVTASTQYFFTIQSADTRSIYISYTIAQVYSGGNAWQNYFSGSAGGIWTEFADDIYFETYYTAGATSVPYSTVSPESILEAIVDSYVNRGGTINYDGTSIGTTGVTTSYTFKVNTILEGIRKVLSLAPANWYWYVDPATNIIYFDEVNTTADHLMIYGRHVATVEIEATIENRKNVGYLSGGDTGGGVNLFLNLNNDDALAEGQRVGMVKVVDNRVTLTSTGQTILQGALDEGEGEKYMTSLTVYDSSYDITLFRPGATVGFAGYGTFVDSLILQIVRVQRQEDSVKLSLGVLPKRASLVLENTQRSLSEVQTVNNPSVPT